VSQTPVRQQARPGWVSAALVTLGFVAVLWAIEIVDVLLGNRLDQEGVQPHDTDGLVGVLFAPLLHAGFGHLAANSVPLLVLGFLVLVTGVARGLAATAVIWIVGGVGTWLFAPEGTVHIGASVLVFGFLTYLVLRGFFARRAGQIVIGLVVLFVYGGLLWGVLPGTPGISWQGHLFGAVGGALAAWLLAPPRGLPQ
jgi:membrane associated rhomboid family serine protease